MANSPEYEKLRNMSGSCGRGFRARLPASDIFVYLRELSPHLAPESRMELEKAVRAAAAAKLPPEVLRYDAAALQRNQIVRRWADGEPLRSRLPSVPKERMREFLAILAVAAPIIDAAAASGIQLPAPLWDKFYFRSLKAARADGQKPLLLETDFHLALDPVRVSDWLPFGLNPDQGLYPTMRPSPPRLSAGAALLELVGSFLDGARWGEEYKYRGVLSPEANAWLAKYWNAKGLPSAWELQAAFRAACKVEPFDHPISALKTEPPPEPPAPPQVPEWIDFPTAPIMPRSSEQTTLQVPPRAEAVVRIAQPQPGRTLQLTRIESSARTWNLITGESFRIGRSVDLADLLVRLLPENEENRVRSRYVSRVHVLLQTAHGRLSLRDGDGISPSRHGATFSGTRLSADHTELLYGDGPLHLLAADLTLWIHFLKNPRAAAQSDTTRDPHSPTFTGAMPGGLTFRMEASAGAEDEPGTIWLISNVGWRPEGEGDFAWQRADDAKIAPATFERADGGFLLRNVALNPASLSVDGEDLPPGATAPLHTGQEFKIGNARWRVAVLAAKTPSTATRPLPIR